MRLMTITFFVSFGVFGSTFRTPQYPNTEWRNQIILFQSTKADVERLLGKPIGQNYGVTYKLKDGILYLDYYDFDHCKSQGRFEADWDLPEWTVAEITYLPDHPPQFAALKPDLKKFRKARLSPHVPDMISYVSEELGIEYTLEGDGRTLHSIRYFPGKQYASLRCSKSQRTN